MWGPSTTFTAGDDPNYKGAKATSMDDVDWSGLKTTTHKLAEDFLKEEKDGEIVFIALSLYSWNVSSPFFPQTKLSSFGYLLGDVESAFREVVAVLADVARNMQSQLPASDPAHPLLELPPLLKTLLERGFKVHAINPKQMDRFRDRFTMAGAKDDSRDAEVMASSLRTDPRCFRPLAVADPTVIAFFTPRASRSVFVDPR